MATYSCVIPLKITKELPHNIISCSVRFSWKIMVPAKGGNTAILPSWITLKCFMGRETN